MKTLVVVLFCFSQTIVGNTDYPNTALRNPKKLTPILCDRFPNLKYCKNSTTPDVPFNGTGVTNEQEQAIETTWRRSEIQESRIPVSKSAVPTPTNQNEVVLRTNYFTEVRRQCMQLLPLARTQCRSPIIDENALGFCKAFFSNCISDPSPSVRRVTTIVTEPDQLEKVASLYDSSVGIVSDAWGVNGIPFYPFNREGSLSGGKRRSAKFGTWGGGYTEDQGVRNFWRDGRRAGGNWYTGEYGEGRHWKLPFLQLGGGFGTDVRVPINPHNFGQPVAVDRRSHVGEFWDGGEKAEVDWLEGSVANGKGWAIPFVGVSGGIGNQITFPSLGEFLPLLADSHREEQN